ncbi:MAG TPA: Asp-tRNA(Asn)/Glu-tRNA(Gln) amidotransferase subunit GatC [Patescibacteria group bacterium]|nr:Asp-tRNA(Asn)/Glu-tRNA(Gln) amidotransferase subunit GatC [Patescibacteria group bacterium]
MKINVKHIATLASMPITASQEEKLEKELEATLEHVKRLEEIDTTQIEGTNEVTQAVNVMREDETEPSLTQEEALMNAKKTYNGFFVVPVILEEAVE